MEEATAIQIRPAKSSDVAFITSSWLNSFRQGFLVEGVPNRVYFHYHHKVIEEVLPKSIVMVACPAEEPDIILGYIVAETVENALVIHYVYVKQHFRKYGIATRLVDILRQSEKPPMLMCTHRTKASAKILANRRDVVLYNPYLLFFQLPAGWESGLETPCKE